MLNPSILDGWEDYTLAKQLYLAKAATITGEHPGTRVKEEAPNVVIRKYTSGTEGNSPALLRLSCVTKGKKGTVLVLTAAQALQAEKISKKQSTMKCDVKEHLIRHKKILKKVRLSKQKKLNLHYILKKIGKKKLLVTT